MYRIEQAPPRVEEYQALRAAVGWSVPSLSASGRALEATAFGVVAREGRRAVGMARLVGDVSMYLFVVDVAVHPDHQGAGLGRRMVRVLVDWAEAHATRTTMLVADAGVVPFYEALGFAADQNRLMTYAPGAPAAPTFRND